MSDLDDKDFEVRAPYIQHTLELETALVALQSEALKQARRELHACQAVIHLAGGFDSRYVSGAQEAIKIADDALSATSETVSAYENEVKAKALEEAADYLDRHMYSGAAPALLINMASELRAKGE